MQDSAPQTLANETPRPNFYGFTLEELASYLQQLGKEKFRAQQLFRWVYAMGVTDFEKMTNLAKVFRQELPDRLNLSLPKVVSQKQSQDGTVKFLFDVGPQQTVEAVLIPSKDRLTLCVSSEVGCNMGCRFCFTGKQRMKRKLRAHEIVGQFLVAQRALVGDQRITNIVFMGMGEPLDNPEGVFKAIEILHNSHGVNFSRKKITVSTSGIVPRIPLVTDSGTRLAVSLNGVNDVIRSQLMPINNKYPMKELLAACREHAQKSKDRVTFEYVLLKGLTDSLEDARRLYKVTRSVPCKINIIPFNEHPGSGFERPSDEVVERFQQELMRLGAHVLLRRTMGRDIYAACGQLTSLYDGRPETLTAP